jgi:hypothetical protein
MNNLNEQNLIGFINQFVEEFKLNCDAWNDNSLEQIIFAKLIKTYGTIKQF